MPTKITFGLSKREVAEAIKEIEQIKRELPVKVKELVRRLTEEGKEIAKLKVKQLDAVYTGLLIDSIDGYFSESAGIGLIHTGNAWYAAFVEFGTGIVGKNSPHPVAEANGWKYDVNDHGEAGWWYPTDDDNLIRYTAPDGKTYGWTKGMASRPFMYETAKELEVLCQQIAKEVFRQ